MNLCCNDHRCLLPHARLLIVAGIMLACLCATSQAQLAEPLFVRFAFDQNAAHVRNALANPGRLEARAAAKVSEKCRAQYPYTWDFKPTGTLQDRPELEILMGRRPVGAGVEYVLMVSLVETEQRKWRVGDYVLYQPGMLDLHGIPSEGELVTDIERVLSSNILENDVLLAKLKESVPLCTKGPVGCRVKLAPAAVLPLDFQIYSPISHSLFRIKCTRANGADELTSRGQGCPGPFRNPGSAANFQGILVVHELKPGEKNADKLDRVYLHGYQLVGPVNGLTPSIAN